MCTEESCFYISSKKQLFTYEICVAMQELTYSQYPGYIKALGAALLKGQTFFEKDILELFQICTDNSKAIILLCLKYTLLQV